jgi:hypothetical protein
MACSNRSSKMEVEMCLIRLQGQIQIRDKLGDQVLKITAKETALRFHLKLVSIRRVSLLEKQEKFSLKWVSLQINPSLVEDSEVLNPL